MKTHESRRHAQDAAEIRTDIYESEETQKHGPLKMLLSKIQKLAMTDHNLCLTASAKEIFPPDRVCEM